MAAASSAAAPKTEINELSINDDVDTACRYLGYPSNHPLFESFKQTLNTKKNRTVQNRERDLYMSLISQSQQNKFITMHGDPLPPEKSGPGKHPHFFQIPPESGIIVVKPAPDGTVVFGSQDEDVDTFRWFLQRNALKAGYRDDAIETGAAPAGASIEGKQNAEDYDQDSSSDDEEPPEKVGELDDEEFTNIGERVSELHRRRVVKAEKIMIKKLERLQKKELGYTNDDVRELKSRYHPKKKEKLLIDGWGSEILHNLQVYFPGDWILNQEQSFEYDETTRTFDKNFNAFLLGQTYSGTPGDIASAYNATFDEKNPNGIPLGFDLTHTDGKGPYDVLSTNNNNTIVYPNRRILKNRIWPRYNMEEAQKYGPDHFMTTQGLIRLALQEGGNQIIFLNSCCPYRESRKMSIGDKFTMSNVGNLLLRNLIFKRGRKNFLRLRRSLPSLNDLPAVIPQYDEHRGITVAFGDDRQEFYLTLGNFLKFVHEGRDIFTPTHFKLFYDLCNTSDPRGNLMKYYFKKYRNFYNETPRRNGEGRWNSRPSKLAGLLSWNDEIDLLDKASQGVHQSTLNQIRRSKMLKQGGRKRRKRRTRKKKKKKRSRSRKKHGGDKTKKKKKEIELPKKNHPVEKSPTQKNNEALQRFERQLERKEEIDRLRRGQYHEGIEHGMTSKRKPAPKKLKKTKDYQFALSPDEADYLFNNVYERDESKIPLRGGKKSRRKKKKRKSRKKRGGRLVWPPIIGTIVSRISNPNILLNVVRIIDNGHNPDSWQVGLRQNNSTPILFRNKREYMLHYFFRGYDGSNPQGMSKL